MMFCQDLFDACLMCDGSGKRVILDFAPFSASNACELNVIKQIFSKGGSFIKLDISRRFWQIFVTICALLVCKENLHRGIKRRLQNCNFWICSSPREAGSASTPYSFFQLALIRFDENTHLMKNTFDEKHIKIYINNSLQ